MLSRKKAVKETLLLRFISACNIIKNCWQCNFADTHIWRQSEFLHTVDDVLNKVMTYRIVDFVVLHDQLTTNTTSMVSAYFTSTPDWMADTEVSILWGSRVSTVTKFRSQQSSVIRALKKVWLKNSKCSTRLLMHRDYGYCFWTKLAAASAQT